MLVECCCFGKVGLMQVLLLDVDTLHRLHILQEGIVSDGAVAVSFDKGSSVAECAKALRGRWFDGRQLCVEIVESPNSAGDPDRASSGPADGAVDSIPPPPRPPKVPKPKAEYGMNGSRQQLPGDAAVRREMNDDGTLVDSILESMNSVGDVEDFLNSLL